MSNEGFSQQSVPPRPIAAVRALTLPKVAFICAATLGVSLAASFVWFLVGMAMFTARGGDWYYLVGELVTAVMLASVFGLVTTGIIALLRRCTRGHSDP